MESNWKGPVNVDANYTLGEMMPGGGQISLKFICPLCDEKSIVEGEVLPAKAADLVRDSEVSNVLDTFYCSCGNEIEIIIWNSIYHPDVVFEGNDLPKSYWYKVEHPEDFLDDDLMQLTLEEIMGEEALSKNKEGIKDYLEKIIFEIQYISQYDKSYITDKIDVIFSIVAYLKKEKSIDDSTYEYYHKLYQSSGTDRDNVLKESLRDIKESVIEHLEKLPKYQEIKRINFTRSDLDKKLTALTDEKDFRELLMAILPNLGFLHCDHNHGVLELGKDIIAITYDNFGIPEGNVFVVKFGKIGKNEAREILKQIEESSNTRYKHPNHGYIKIKRIYSITNDTYTPQAKDFLEKNTQSIIQMVSFLDRNILLEYTKKRV